MHQPDIYKFFIIKLFYSNNQSGRINIRRMTDQENFATEDQSRLTKRAFCSLIHDY